jgi:hypothetical protein
MLLERLAQPLVAKNSFVNVGVVDHSTAFAIVLRVCTLARKLSADNGPASYGDNRT